MKLEKLVSDMEDQDLRVRIYEVPENQVYEVNTPIGCSIGKGPVVIMIIRE